MPRGPHGVLVDDSVDFNVLAGRIALSPNRSRMSSIACVAGAHASSSTAASLL